MIEWVASPGDPRLEPYRHVADPVWIRDRDLFVAEGRLVVERLIELDRFEIHSILVNRAAHDALFERLSAVAAPVLVCDDPTLTSITGYNFHRGCLALAARPRPSSIEHLVPARRLLALESVANPDNVGGLFRTAAAFGVDGLMLNATSGDPLYRKAVRTSMGASLRLPFVRLDPWLSGLADLRTRGFRLLALTPSADARPLTEVAATLAAQDRVIVLVGAEGEGLNAESMAAADARVRIAIESAVDSLNVVVAAAIALHALRGW